MVVSPIMRRPFSLATLPYLLEDNADPVLLDPKDSAVEHDTTVLGHKLKPIGNVVWIRHIDSGPMSGYIYDTTADAHPIAMNLRGMKLIRDVNANGATQRAAAFSVRDATSHPTISAAACCRYP